MKHGRFGYQSNLCICFILDLLLQHKFVVRLKLVEVGEHEKWRKKTHTLSKVERYLTDKKILMKRLCICVVNSIWVLFFFKKETSKENTRNE